MNLADQIQKSYRSGIRFLRRYLLLLFLLICYYTAYRLLHPEQAKFFTRAELLTLHRLCGFMLLFFLFLLAYDWADFFLYPVLRKKQKHRLNLEAYRDVPLQQWVNRVFYLLLGLLGLLGFIYYMANKGAFVFLPRASYFLILHEALGWLLVSVIVVKVYFNITLWAQQTLKYLKEY